MKLIKGKNYVARTEKGNKTDINGDSFFVDKELGIIYVADGVSGARRAEEASSAAVTTASERASEIIGANGRLELSDLVPIVTVANEAVIETSGFTTFEMVVLPEDPSGKFLFAYVGDSVLWRSSTGEQMVAHQGFGSTLLHWLGPPNKAQEKYDPEKVQTGAFKLRQGELLVVASDGVNSFAEDEASRSVDVRNDFMAKVRRAGEEHLVSLVTPGKSLQGILDDLMRVATERGDDDTTVVLYRHQIS